MNWFKSDFNIRAWRFIDNYDLNKAPNVTLIYGLRGVGKSTMLSFLYKRLGLKGKGILTDSLSFARQYAYAAQENNLKQFRLYYRSARLLLLDDLQHLAGKVKTIEELTYTYEYILGNGGKMVTIFEGDGPRLDFLGERLASRFLSGLVLPVTQPQAEEVEAFLDEYCHSKHLVIEKAVLQEISGKENNLADALRTIKNFIEYAEFQQNALNLQCFQAYWDNEEKKINSRVSPENIMRLTASAMDVSLEDLRGSTRKPKVNEARLMAIYLVRTLVNIPFHEIGKYFNRRHSTMILAYNKMEQRLNKDQYVYDKYREILKALKS